MGLFFYSINNYIPAEIVTTKAYLISISSPSSIQLVDKDSRIPLQTGSSRTGNTVAAAIICASSRSAVDVPNFSKKAAH